MKVLRCKLAVLIGLLFFLQFLSGCQGDELPEGEVRLSEILENPEYLSLSLLDTEWKLIGFVDELQGKVRLAEPTGEDTYLLAFDENGEIRGRTSTNTAFGKYLLDSNSKMAISEFSHLTKINELFDGRYFIESMNKVSSFNLSTRGLALYFDDQKFMLFKPR